METGGTSTTESEIPSSPSGSGPGGLAPEAIVGLIVGVSLSLVLGVAIAMFVLCLVKHGQARGKCSTGQVYGLGTFIHN